MTVLDIDPDLVETLDPEEVALARRVGVAEMRELQCGAWRPDDDMPDEPGTLGLFVLDGLMTRNVVLGGRSCTELLGQGDLLQPRCCDDSSFAPVPTDCEWCVLEEARIAVLDRRFAVVAGRLPELMSTLVSRTLRRSHALALQLAIDQVRGIDVRILLMLWHLADRWGKVGREGVIVPMRLTHQMIANLTGLRRPSVSTALGQLVGRGVLRRRPDGSWLLCGDPPCEHRSLEAAVLAGEGRRAVSPDPSAGPDLQLI